MQEIKLIATDLDGTFLQENGMPSREAVEAVRACRDKGIRVCVCTGRSYAEVVDICRAGEVDDLAVLTNGLSIINWRTKEYMLERRLDPKMAKPTLEALVEDCRRHPGSHLGVTCMFSSHICREVSNPVQLHAWETRTLWRWQNTQMHETIGEWIDACGHDAQRINYSLDCYEEGARVKALLAPYADVSITTGGLGRMEIVPGKDVSKSDSLQRLIDKLGIARENVMAIGDNVNDTDMLAWAGFSVAMGNAVPKTLEVADCVTDRVENEGFAKAIYHYVLKNR
ncbi:MAG: HAD family phosphatase [Clostridia bacterium]|nr:HAD family phosphatase [Clostridia bacterium]